MGTASEMREQKEQPVTLSSRHPFDYGQNPTSHAAPRGCRAVMVLPGAPVMRLKRLKKKRNQIDSETGNVIINLIFKIIQALHESYT